MKERKSGNTKAQDCPAIQNELVKIKLVHYHRVTVAGKKVALFTTQIKYLSLEPTLKAVYEIKWVGNVV